CVRGPVARIGSWYFDLW
nr:immunoglobulin heavy chain junction region [Macaca mulatta]